MLISQELNSIAEALPERFSFYHLGEVQAQPLQSSPDEDDFTDSTGVAFAIQGDARGWLLVTFDSGLDYSTYTEMGNILASQLANRLSTQGSLPTMISPPHPIPSNRLKTLVQNSTPDQQRDYWHVQKDHINKIRVFILPNSNEDIAHA